MAGAGVAAAQPRYLGEHMLRVIFIGLNGDGAAIVRSAINSGIFYTMPAYLVTSETEPFNVSTDLLRAISR